MSGLKQQARHDLGSLINQHRLASSLWTPENDGLTHDIADDIKAALMAAGLTQEQSSYLLGNVL